MKILVCTDGSEISDKVLREAARFTLCLQIDEVTVIHVYQDTVTVPDAQMAQSFTSKQLMDFWDVNKDIGMKILEKARILLAEKNIKVKTILKGGNPIQEIAKVANEEKYDLLIIGSRGLGGLKKLILGSVSSGVVQEVKSSVLLIK